jgi:hypothetical protein
VLTLALVIIVSSFRVLIMKNHSSVCGRNFKSLLQAVQYGILFSSDLVIAGFDLIFCKEERKILLLCEQT